MRKRPRRNHNTIFKAKVTLAALKGEKTPVKQFDVPPNQITTWRAQFLEGAAGILGGEAKHEPTAPAIDVKKLHAKIGELTLENYFCPGRSGRPNYRRVESDDRPERRLAGEASDEGSGRWT
jgi:transposase